MSFFNSYTNPGFQYYNNQGIHISQAFNMNQGYNDNQGFNLNQACNWDLFTAIWEGNHYNVERLILQGTNIHVTNLNSQGYTPLTYAISFAQYEIARLLLAYGVDPNAADANGSYPLILALNEKCVNTSMQASNKMKFLNMMVAKGANLNVEDYYTRKSALNLAIENGFYQITEVLIENGADVNYRDSTLSVPLITAIEMENLLIVELLTSYGAILFIANHTRRHALTLAVEKGNVEIIKSLIEYNKSFNDFDIINAQDNYGELSMNLAVRQGNIEIVKILISNGANVNAKDMYGKFPLGTAIQEGNVEIAKLLIQNEADVDLIEGSPYSDMIFQGMGINSRPIELALTYENVEMVNLLIRSGAQTNYISSDGSSLFNIAIEDNSLEVIKTLVENGAKINASDGNFLTPMHKAVIYRRPEIVEYLLGQGASIYTQAKPSAKCPMLKHSPLEVSLEDRNLDIVKLICFNTKQEK